jgi:hypothetical protein
MLRITPIYATFTAVVIATLLSGCGGPSAEPASAPVGGATQTATDAAAEAAAAAQAAAAAEDAKKAETAAAAKAAVPAHSNSWNFVNGSKYTYTLTINLWEPSAAPSAAHPANPALSVGSVCGFDPATDIAIPAEFVTEATTAGFPTLVSVSALFVNAETGGSNGRGSLGASTAYTGSGAKPADHDNRLSVEQWFGTESQPQCRIYSSTNMWGGGGASSFGASWSVPFQQGQTGKHDFFVIVKNYLSPATPDGDAALLNWITLRPMFSGGDVGKTETYVDADSAYVGIYSSVGITLSGTVLRP